ncbi:putative holin-like toxin [Paenibacillus sp. P26]|nr:putative holin-like toxin [Paenibacillus sp. P26]UUZ94491.1 putative holin-like toxin [Paenibacillus sp. P25]
MEVKDSLSLMFMFGMFILALLSYLKRSRPPLSLEAGRSSYRIPVC